MNVVAQNDIAVSPEVATRLQERVVVMKSALQTTTPITGYARRVTFNPEFMKVARLIRTRYLRGRFIHSHKRSVRVRHALAS